MEDSLLKTLREKWSRAGGVEALNGHAHKVKVYRERPESGNSIFSKRESEIVHLLSRGYNSREIADLLFISPSTVRTHRKNIHAKAGTHSVIELLLKARKERWI